MNFVPDTSSLVKPSIPDEPKSFIMCYEVAAPIDTIEETVTKPGNIMSYYKDSTLDMMGNKLTLPPKKNEGYFRNNA